LLEKRKELEMNTLNKEYREAIDIIEEARREIDKILEKQPEVKGVENLEAYYLLEDTAERLGSARNYLQYLSAPTKEGRLREDSNGKFFIEYMDGTESHLLSCGNPLELFLEDDWVIARVEAKDGKYYFHAGDKPFLYEGMRARKREI